MIITISTSFWDAVARLADVTWLIAFFSADVWVLLAGVRIVRKKIHEMKVNANGLKIRGAG
jgi:hypothetical protein